MRDANRWMELCEMAATERDPEKLLELIQEIDDLLEEKFKRLKGKKVHGVLSDGG